MTTAPDAPAPRNLVIASIEDHPKAILLLLAARRLAREKGMRWQAVFTETPGRMGMKDGSQERMLQLFTLAGQMGGEGIRIEAENIEKGLALLLEKEKNQVGWVILGSTEGESHSRFGIHTPAWMRLVRLASKYSQVEIIPLSGQPYHQGLSEKLGLHALRPLYFFYTLLAVGVAFLASLLIGNLFPDTAYGARDKNAALMLMVACAFVAERFGLMPGLLASVSSAMIVDYYFTIPYRDLSLVTATDIVSLLLFLSTTVMVALLTSRPKDYARKVAKRELGTKALFTLYRTASTAFTREQALEKLQQKLAHMLEMEVAFFLPSSERIEAAFPAAVELAPEDRKALDLCWSETKATGLASPEGQEAAWRFEPMVASGSVIGVMGVKPRSRSQLDAWFGQFLSAIADQTASIIQHIDLERTMQETRLREEREQLRSILLSSVSHDFKTPLAGIIGALSVHRSLGERLTPQKRAELIDSAIEEAQRLDSFITNILDMTRLESCDIRFRKEWYSFEAMVAEVTRRLKHRLRQHQLAIDLCAPDVEVYADIMMTEQVLQNVLDNASKYTPPGTCIDISCQLEPNGRLICFVHDHGPGLPPDRLNHIFDKYARLHKKDSQIAGTGLGLAISKTIMEAQGGSIVAANHPEGGALFTLCLPQWRRLDQTKGASGDIAYKQAHHSH
ncbi:MAG: DUF4118 domain-containing protein [Pseudomonadota bacterium]|nr:DUF4118 domain-containing protein [Pseudomonadota bacterium]